MQRDSNYTLNRWITECWLGFTGGMRPHLSHSPALRRKSNCLWFFSLFLLLLLLFVLGEWTIWGGATADKMKSQNVFMNYAIVSKIASDITQHPNTVINDVGTHLPSIFIVSRYQFNLLTKPPPWRLRIQRSTHWQFSLWIICQVHGKCGINPFFSLLQKGIEKKALEWWKFR